jgi:hypothetical protein
MAQLMATAETEDRRTQHRAHQPLGASKDAMSVSGRPDEASALAGLGTEAFTVPIWLMPPATSNTYTVPPEPAMQ